MNSKKGKFIVFEGVEGCGKSTQTKLCTSWLDSIGIPALSTLEPGGTNLGMTIREIILSPQNEISPKAELLLYAADRAQHIDSFVDPMLNSGVWVVSDRYTPSTFAYQGWGRQGNMKEIEQIVNISSSKVIPDLVIWLNISPEEGLKRKKKNQLDRIEMESIIFHQRVAEGYKNLHENSPNSIEINVDKGKTVFDIFEDVKEAIQANIFMFP